MHESDAAPVRAAEIVVNGAPRCWRPALTLAELLRECAKDHESVATAVNGRFVPRQEREQTALAAGDAVLVFGAIVGG
jgi:sulfur carrier protein